MDALEELLSERLTAEERAKFSDQDLSRLLTADCDDAAALTSATTAELRDEGLTLGKALALKRAFPAGAQDVAEPKEHEGALSEGIRARLLRGQFGICRKALTGSILDRARVRGSILIKAPPQTGKTAILQLLADRAKQQVFADGSKVWDKVIFISMLDGQNLPEVFDKHSYLQGKSFAELSTTPSTSPDAPSSTSTQQKRTLLLVDEAQLLYSHPKDMNVDGASASVPPTSDRAQQETSAFWKHVKSSHQRPGTLTIIMAGMYGSKPSGVESPEQNLCTPVVFSPAEAVSVLPEMPKKSDPSTGGSLDPLDANVPLLLNISALEYKDLLDEFHKFGDLARFGKLSGPVSDYLYNITAGQVGMITFFLDEVVDKLRREHGNNLDLMDTLARHMLARADPFSMLGSQGRSFSTLASVVQEVDVLQELLKGTKVLLDDPGDLAQQAKRLLRQGLLLVDDKGCVRFPSPLHRWHYEKQLYLSRAESIPAGEVGFNLFIRRCLERMSADQMKDSISCDKFSKLYEAQYQKQFYAAAVSLLPRDHTISPEVGQVYGTSGKVDFVVTLPTNDPWKVTDTVWAVELLRDGNKGQEHEERFNAPTGLYSKLPIQPGCKAVIDFHASAPTDGFQMRHGTHYVFLSEDRKSAQYFRPGADVPELIKLLSEEMTSALHLPTRGGAAASTPMEVEGSEAA